MTEIELRDNIKRIQGNIAGRAVLLAATKTVPVEVINSTYDMGIRVIGENRVSELMEKYDRLDKRFEIHFIGTLQKNKVKYIIGKVSLIHSLDSLPLSEEIDRRSAQHGVITDCLVEVNIGREDSKGGIMPEELDSFLEAVSRLEHIRVRGLMVIPPKCVENEKNLCYFQKIRAKFIDNTAKKVDNISMDILSMGMTHDYIQAIEAGSTLVRIGEGIFGKRIYNIPEENHEHNETL